MATGVQVWNQTAANNATSDSNINWAEGMAPSAVNDSARAVMASVAKWRDDNNGTLVTGGSSSALTLVTNQIEGALTSGYRVHVTFGTNVDANATLAVDGLAATPLQLYNGTNLVGGEFLAGSNWCFTYSSTGTGQWIAQPTPAFSVVTGTLGANVTISSTSYIDGPVATLGTSMGVWLITACASVSQLSGTPNFQFKLWDKTTVIASGTGTVPVSGGLARVAAQGIITNPSTSVRLAFAKQIPSAGNTVVVANNTGEGKDSMITAVRIG